MSLARQAGFNKTAVESFNDNLAVAMAYGFAHFSQLSNLCLRQGCPTCGPGAACSPLEHFMRPWSPPQKSRASHKNYYCYLLIVHFYIYTADFLFCASDQGPLALTDFLLTLNQCLCLGLHNRRLCTRYFYTEFKTYNQSPGPTKSYIYITFNVYMQ